MNFSENPRIVIAGSVNSSLQTLKKLVEHNSNLVGVLGLNPDVSSNVSGFVDLRNYAEEKNILFQYFNKINDEEVYSFMKELQPDLFFVIGLSQMIREPLLSLAKNGNVGFHPTKLPEGRGRGAVAWIILEKVEGAATFFLLDEGMDSGAILGQSDFNIDKNDYAIDVIEKIKFHIDIVLDKMLPKLNLGNLTLMKQNHLKATYIGQRKPKDGLINWGQAVEEIHRFIRASSRPLPGAFTIINESKLIIYKATVERDNNYIGIPGRIIQIKGNRPLVTCGNGALWIDEYYCEDVINFKIGQDI